MFAAQTAESQGSNGALLYTGDFLELRSGISNRFSLAEVDASFRIVRRDVRVDGAWERAGGSTTASYRATGELRRLVDPGDERSKSILDALS